MDANVAVLIMLAAVGMGFILSHRIKTRRYWRRVNVIERIPGDPESRRRLRREPRAGERLVTKPVEGK